MKCLFLDDFMLFYHLAFHALILHAKLLKLETCSLWKSKLNFSTDSLFGFYKRVLKTSVLNNTDQFWNLVGLYKTSETELFNADFLCKFQPDDFFSKFCAHSLIWNAFDPQLCPLFCCFKYLLNQPTIQCYSFSDQSNWSWKIAVNLKAVF